MIKPIQYIKVVILILCYSCFGQIGLKRVKEVSDSIILAETEKDFFDNLFVIDTTSYKNGEDGIIYFSSKRQPIEGLITNDPDTTLYSITYKVGDSDISLINANGGISKPNFSLHFLEHKGLYYLSSIDYSDYKKYLFNIQNKSLIDKEKANEIAFQYLPKGTRNVRKSQLVYHVKDECFYWLVTSRKGHSNVTEYTAYINANNGEFSKTENIAIHRGFFNAIGDFFSGAY